MASLSAAGAAPLRNVELPPTERFSTSNGLSVVVAERGPLPLVSIRLVIRAGSSSDPQGKLGLSDFTSRLMRRGTKKLSASEIDEAVEFVGGSLNLGVNEDAFFVSITAPSEHLESMLAVMGQVIREPTFPKEEVTSAKKRVLAQLANDLDDPGVIADRAFSQAIWGDHPYGHDPLGKKAHIASFTRDDLVRFHKEKLGPKVSTLFIVGDAPLSRVKAAVEKAFAGWSSGPDTAPVIPPAVPRLGALVVVDKPEQTQAQVRLGAQGMRRGDPDQIPATVMNTSLGGGFTSRLVNEVRVKRGLSYGVGSYFSALKAGGLFEVSTFTKTESTREMLDVLFKEVEKGRKGFTPQELSTSRRYLAGLYPLRIETNEAVASALSEIELYGLGEDWVEQYRSRVAAVTPQQVTAVAKRYLFPEKPSVVLVGKAKEIVAQLKGLGEVTQVKVSELE